MKPAPFTYHRPTTLGDAVTLLTELAPHDGRVLAGGQSLVPIMAFRLAYPAHLIDINAIAGLDGLAVRNDKLCIGARVRHGDFHRPIDEGPLGALLAVVVRHIAHYPIRLRGTFCGSLAHADPAAEWCVVAATLNAELVALGAAGERRMAVHEFLRGALETALAPDELLLEARLPTLPDDTHFGFAEFSRRAGDYGLAMGPCGIPQVDRGPAREPDGGEPFAPAAPPCPRRGRVSRAILINSDISRRRAMASAE